MKKGFLLMFITLVTIASSAQNVTKRIAAYNLEKRVAIQGYDPVGYFKQNKAVKGKAALATTYEGVTYYFSSPANKDSFAKNPAGFEPQYGGWCAYAMGSSAEKVEINPETIKIVDGKLYLIYKAFFNNTLKSWNKDETNLKVKADGNWKKFLK